MNYLKKIFCVGLLSFITVVGMAQKDFRPKSVGAIVKHTYYELAYSEWHDQAIWVYYHLTPKFITGDILRSRNFRDDPKVKTQSASINDYWNSAYHPGHMCPPEVMKANKKSMSETYFMSNVSPQTPELNSGIWKELESNVKSWTMFENEIYVVTGPVFRGNLGKIGANKVTVPGAFFKVIYDPTGQQKMIAFIIPNKKKFGKLKEYVVTVNEVEKVTNIDFFPQLPDAEENRLESRSDFTKWGHKYFKD